MTPPPKDELPPGMDEIRSLLLTEDVLVSRVSQVLLEVLEEKVTHSKNELAKTLAPAITEAIRLQLYQARDDLVDALAPAIGMAISKAVSEALRTLVQNIDARLKANNPLNQWQRWQSKLRGVPPSEYQLRLLLPFTVQEIFLIHRESGLLIYYYSEDEQSDRDLVSGMLTAIRDFAREAFGRGQSGEVGSIEYENQKILLQARGNIYMAVVVEGTPPEKFRLFMDELLMQFNREHYKSLKNFDGTDEALHETAQNLVQMLYAQTKFEPLLTKKGLTRFQKVLFALLSLVVVVLLCSPFVLCSLWVWRIESRLAVLAVPPPTATATPMPTAVPPTSTMPMPPTATFTALPSPSPTVTATPAPQFSGQVNQPNLNLYAQADFTSPVVATLSENQPFTAIARSEVGEWVKIVVTEGQSGWVESRYVQINGLISVLPVE